MLKGSELTDSDRDKTTTRLNKNTARREHIILLLTLMCSDVSRMTEATSESRLNPEPQTVQIVHAVHLCKGTFKSELQVQ